jgi:hypothetical protein
MEERSSGPKNICVATSIGDNLILIPGGTDGRRQLNHLFGHALYLSSTILSELELVVNSTRELCDPLYAS